ncbi:MAG TPA: glycoside hydrolase family 99-like domain-containing protein, partial [Magnetospirillaceae bacterium]|nr:glycoside hydrolase family 99-like domain-containing protein [Magnetospirillaceae bacterium]
MLVLAFFDTGFMGTDERWRRLRESRPASRQHFPLNLPSTLGQYDLAKPEQTAPVVGMARQAGIDGFVIDCRWLGGAYRHDAAALAP